MIIVKDYDQYDEQNIYFCEPIKNNVINNSYFIKIIYSNSLFILNGINLLIQLNDIILNKYYNKYKCTFNPSIHKDFIEKYRIIERNILRKSNIKKIPQYKIYDQIKNGNIKIFLFNDDVIVDNYFMLKISGIWETDTHFGLTYKFHKLSIGSKIC
jgi:hypothetical protein